MLHRFTIYIITGDCGCQWVSDSRHQLCILRSGGLSQPAGLEFRIPHSSGCFLLFAAYYCRPRIMKSMPAPIPPNEKQRLHVLWQYDVLDTVPEEVFDDLT